MNISPSSNVAIIPGDILYTMSGTVGNVAVYPVNGELATCSNTIARARVNNEKENDPYFLALFLNSKLGMAQSFRLISGGVLGHVMPNSVKKLIVIKPSQAIQYAIGNKIRKAEQLRGLAHYAKAQAETALADLLDGVPTSAACRSSWVPVQFVYDRMDPSFYRPDYLKLEQGLRALGRTIYTLGNLISHLRNGLDYRDFSTKGLPYIRVADVDMYEMSLDHAARVNVHLSEIPEQQLLRIGDILLTRKGSFGKVTVVDEDIVQSIISSEVILLRPREGLDPYALAIFLNSPYGRAQFERCASGTTMQGLTRDTFERVLVPGLSLEEQVTLGTFAKTSIAAIRESEELIRLAKSEVEALINGTLDQEQLLVEGEKIARWLEANSSPSAQGKEMQSPL